MDNHKFLAGIIIGIMLGFMIGATFDGLDHHYRKIPALLDKQLVDANLAYYEMDPKTGQPILKWRDYYIAREGHDWLVQYVDGKPADAFGMRMPKVEK